MTTRTVPTATPAYSSNDSHIHFSAEHKARREKLGLTLKAGETDEVEAPGPIQYCRVCYPEGDGPAPECPGNVTYDNSIEIAEANEKEALRKRVESLEEYIRSQQKDKAPAPAVKPPPRAA